ncbi:hypothetical protein SAMN05443545_101313 [Aidingimonas halophila]|uniref:Uncharacterized protein n=1 Tax=Aidingimonas halophila TaxID=574349 RepID=A0A1H2RGM1_9GAMM|nr:hypothetical protein GCM10008094_06590 [Aidingimonas halophila]SDW18310.1 hypothetical protein SAMN05443545_101313 [Aidingimonas halophila]
MRTTQTTTPRVYLHPAAANNPATVQRIQRDTRSLAVYSRDEKATRLIPTPTGNGGAA